MKRPGKARLRRHAGAAGWSGSHASIVVILPPLFRLLPGVCQVSQHDTVGPPKELQMRAHRRSMSRLQAKLTPTDVRVVR